EARRERRVVVLASGEAARARPPQYGHRLGVAGVAGGEVEVAVAIEVGGDDHAGVAADVESQFLLHGAVAVAEVEADEAAPQVGRPVRHGEVHVAILVEVAAGELPGPNVAREGPRRLERAVAVVPADEDAVAGAATGAGVNLEV